MNILFIIIVKIIMSLNGHIGAPPIILTTESTQVRCPDYSYVGVTWDYLIVEKILSYLNPNGSQVPPFAARLVFLYGYVLILYDLGQINSNKRPIFVVPNFRTTCFTNF
jgi:hypothetical protein